MAMASAIVELGLPAACPLVATPIGANDRGPTGAKHNPVADFQVLARPTKFESVNKNNLHSWVGSPMWHAKLTFNVELM